MDEFFPYVTGENLNGKLLRIPDGLETTLSLLIVVFRQRNQRLVDTWVIYTEELEKQHSEFTYYELPTLSTSYRLFRGWIDGGMRSGITDPRTRERTITVYKKSTLMSSLGLEKDDDVHLYLVDRTGRVLWKEHGEADEGKAEQLRLAVEAHA